MQNDKWHNRSESAPYAWAVAATAVAEEQVGVLPTNASRTTGSDWWLHWTDWGHMVNQGGPQRKGHTIYSTRRSIMGFGMRFVWGLCFLVFFFLPKLLFHYSHVQDQVKNCCNSSLQCSGTIFEGILVTFILLDSHFYMLFLYSAGWKSEVLSYVEQLLDSVIWSFSTVQ